MQPARIIHRQRLAPLPGMLLVLAFASAAPAQPIAPPVGGTSSMLPTTHELLPRSAPPPGPRPGALLPAVPPPTPGRGQQRAFSPGWVTHQNPRPAGPMVVPEAVDVEAFADRIVLGADEREWVWDTRAFPYSAVVKVLLLRPDGWTYCSGFVVQPNFVLTAGHCIYKPEDDEFAEDIIVVPAQSGIFEWYGRWDWERVWARSEWTEHAPRAFDIGVIEVRGDIAEQTGAFGTVAIDDARLFDADLELAGYPGSNEAIMHTASCRADDGYVDRRLIRHACDTEPGQSGSPIWTTFGGGDPVAVAVHTIGVDDAPEPYNGGVRLYDDIYAWYADIVGLCGEDACTFGSCRADSGERCGFDGTCGAWMPGDCGEGYACVDETCTCLPDDQEPDGDADESTRLRVGEPLSGRICTDDHDWYRFELAVGQSVTIELRFIHAEGDLELEFLEENGDVIALAETGDDDERIAFTAERDGRWFLRVFGYRGSQTRYAIELVDPEAAPLADAGAPDAGAPDASPVDAGVPDARPADAMPGAAADAGAADAASDPPLVDAAQSPPADAAQSPTPDARPADVAPPVVRPDAGSGGSGDPPTGCVAAPVDGGPSPGAWLGLLALTVGAGRRRSGTARAFTPR